MDNLLLLRIAAEGIQKVAAWDLPEPSWGAKAISRADVAHFLLGAAERSEHIRQVVGLAR